VARDVPVTDPDLGMPPSGILFPMKAEPVIREATSADLHSLADLKVQWASLAYFPSTEERAEFAEALGEWMDTMGDSLVCRVAEVNGALVGMAWMVIFERVPDIHNRKRATGDVQSVFVASEYRGRGIGLALVRAVCETADILGVPRVTVSANECAAPLYSRAGFTPSPILVERRRS
jgi:GNAT superfamily N-acetyltransferase